MDERRYDICKKAAKKRGEWHSSEQGRKQHTEWNKQRWAVENFKKYKCIQCKNEFKSRARVKPKYCSRKCKRLFSIANFREDRKCIVCGNVFNVYKGYPNIACSSKCGRYVRYDVRRKPVSGDGE